MIELLTFLSDILQRNGLKGLLNHPKKLYQRMLMADIEPKIAGAVVVSVLANIPKMIIDDRSLNRDQIVELIRITCPLNDEISEQLADLYLLLLDKKNIASLQNDIRGFYFFCQKQWSLQLNSLYYCEDQESGQRLCCMVTAGVDFAVQNVDILYQSLSQFLRENPNVSELHILEYFKYVLNSMLDQELEKNVQEELKTKPFSEINLNDYDFEKFLTGACSELSLAVLNIDVDSDCSFDE
jgi:hypothetical protein